MRGLGTLLFILFVLYCGLSVSGLALQKFGVSDKMVAEMVQKEGWGTGTHWNVEQQFYAATIMQVGRGPSSSKKLLLIGGVPVKLYEAGSYGLEVTAK